MTVYGDVVTAIEVLISLIFAAPFILYTYFKLNKGFFPQEIKSEALVIVAGLLIPLAILHLTFSGLNDWKLGHSSLFEEAIVLLIVIFMSFMFWSTLTPSALMLIGIRLGLLQERIDSTGARKIWDYFLVWNKMLRIYGELCKWGAVLIFLGFTVALPIYANIVDSQPTAYIMFCCPLFFVILYFFQDRSKVPPSTTFSTPTDLPMMFEVVQRMNETGFMEQVEAGGGNVLGIEGIVEALQEDCQEPPVD